MWPAGPAAPGLPEADERQDGEDHDHDADDVEDVVHGCALIQDSPDSLRLRARPCSSKGCSSIGMPAVGSSEARVNDGRPPPASSRVLSAGSSNPRRMALPSALAAAMARSRQAAATGGPRTRSIRCRVAANSVPAAPPPRRVGGPRSGRGGRPGRRSSPTSRATWLATTARPRWARRASVESWRGCSQREQLQAHGIVPEDAARQAHPAQCQLAFLDPLLCRAASIVKLANPLGRPLQIGDDEADPRVQLTLVPFDLGHHPPRSAPALRLVAETGKEHLRLLRWTPHRPAQQVCDPLLQDRVGRQANGIADALGLEQLVELGLGERRVAAEVEDKAPVAILISREYT